MVKLSVFCLLLVSAVLSSASPLNGYSRFSMIPNAEGQMHLIDLEAPQEPEMSFVPETDIRFMLYTRSNPGVGQRLLFRDLSSVSSSNFNAAHPTRFTIHGWLGSEQSTVNRNVATEKFIVGDFNMITVDWSVGADTLNYITARNRCPETGRVVAQMADFLHENGLLRFEDTHFIGHSLGGQIVGLAGKALTRGRVQVITSLDPAGPLFSINSPNERVAPTDGVYVEVIHTNGGTLGFMEPIGQMDVYPNYGRTQPGCGVAVSGQCAHEVVNNFHAESIRTVFTAHQCQSYDNIVSENCIRTGVTTRMGGPTGSIGSSGIFHLTTNAASPFSQG